MSLKKCTKLNKFGVGRGIAECSYESFGDLISDAVFDVYDDADDFEQPIQLEGLNDSCAFGMRSVAKVFNPFGNSIESNGINNRPFALENISTKL